MNILYFSHYSGIGGANKSMLDMCTQIREEGHHPYIIIPSKGEIEKLLQENELEYAVYPYLNWICDADRNTHSFIHKIKIYRRTIINLCILRELAVFARRNKIELIHTNDSLTIEGFMLSRYMKIPHVWHIREFLDEDYRLKYAYPESLVKKCYNRSEAVIAISQSIMDKYQSFIPKIQLAYNGIYLSNITSYIKKDDLVRIVFAGGQNPKKGIGDVLGAMRILYNKKMNVQFILAGTFSEESKERITSEFDAGFCNCIGYTSNIYEIYATAHIAIIASEKEAFGRVTIEGMLHKCAVIASDTGANVELVTNGVTGLLYEQGNSLSLAEKIEKLYLERDLLESIANQAYTVANMKYTMAAAAKRYVEIYDSVTK